MTQTTSQLIHQLREQTPTLEALAGKRVKLTHYSGKTNMASAPTPVNLGAADLVDQLRELCLLLCRAASLHPASGMSLMGLLAGLDRPFVVERLESRADADDVRRVLDSACRRVRWMVEPDERIRCVGVCANCGYGVWVGDHEDLEHGTYRCELCGEHGDLSTVVAAHRLRLLTSGTVDTAAALADLLRNSGYKVAKSTVRSWAKRGKLRSVGVNDDGLAVYALADVLRLLI